MTLEAQEIPQEAYSRMVDALGDEVSVEDIWTESRDEGPVCVIEVHRRPDQAEAALSGYEQELQRIDPRFHFVVRVGRVGRTSIAHLVHSSKKELTAIRGPIDWHSGSGPSLLLSELSGELTPPDGWKVWFQTLWDQLILEDVTFTSSGSVTEAKAGRGTVVHLRDPAADWSSHEVKPTGT